MFRSHLNTKLIKRRKKFIFNLYEIIQVMNGDSVLCPFVLKKKFNSLVKKDVIFICLFLIKNMIELIIIISVMYEECIRYLYH